MDALLAEVVEGLGGVLAQVLLQCDDRGREAPLGQPLLDERGGGAHEGDDARALAGGRGGQFQGTGPAL